MDNNVTDKLNILTVDDSFSARIKIVSSLDGLHANIFEADDGTTALDILRDNKDIIDLVISDLVMINMHGDELCSIIRTELGLTDLPVIILSSNNDKETVLNLFQAGATDYLFKPFTPQELLARIRSHLEQRKLNKILKHNIQKLSELNRMKDHFLAACSHDFRSPLQGIMGFTELLISDGSINEMNQSILANILEAGKQLHDLIESLLDFSLAGHKPEDIPMIPLDLVAVLESCVTNTTFSAGNKGITLEMNLCKGLPFLTGNPNALSRIFSNLLSNAVKFTPPGGSVTIDFNNLDNQAISVSISDTGVGITDEVVPIIFDRYSKASRKGTQGEKSTGLGLYITKQLIEIHNGSIDVKSQPDKGSCFTVTFPISSLEKVSDEQSL